MIKGIGTDIVLWRRFSDLINKRSAAHMNKFSGRFLNEKHELPKFLALYEAAKTEESSKYLASCWSVKELIYKSLDAGQQGLFVFKEWFKRNDAHGRPHVGSAVSGERSGLFEGDEFLVSVSHDGEYVVSTVVRQGGNRGNEIS